MRKVLLKTRYDNTPDKEPTDTIRVPRELSEEEAQQIARGISPKHHGLDAPYLNDIHKAIVAHFEKEAP